MDARMDMYVTNKPMALIMKATIAALILPFTLVACDRKPESYEDCIVENMKGINSDVAAYSIRAACKEKFEKPNPFDKFDNQN